MRRYNFVRPILLIVTALLVKSVVTNLSLLMGATKDVASNLGFMAMIVAALLIFTRMNKRKGDK